MKPETTGPYRPAEEIAADIMRRMVNPNVGWLSLVAEAYAFRSSLVYSKRRLFDDALRPITGDGDTITYPDAFYYFNAADLVRAKAAVGGNDAG